MQIFKIIIRFKTKTPPTKPHLNSNSILPKPLPLTDYEPSHPMQSEIKDPTNKNFYSLSFAQKNRIGPIISPKKTKKNPKHFKMLYEEQVINQPGRPFFKQPSPGFFMRILNDFEMRQHFNKNIDNFIAGDIVDLEMFKNLKQPIHLRKTTVKRGFIVSKRNRGYGSTFIFRCMDRNNEAYEVSYPLYSPFIKKLKLIRREEVKKSKCYSVRKNINALSVREAINMRLKQKEVNIAIMNKLVEKKRNRKKQKSGERN